jgi:hypothetical protein
MEKLNLRKVAEMSDREVYGLSVLRPSSSKEIRGFMFLLKAFENTEEMALCMSVLSRRLLKINENK